MSLFRKQSPKESSSPETEPQQPVSEQFRTSTPTWFIERLTEKERLSLQRTRFDEYFEAEGWAGEVGGNIEFMTPGFIRQSKPFILAKKHLRDLIAQQKDEKDWSDMGDMWEKYKETVIEAEKLGSTEGTAYLDLAATRLISKSKLGMEEKYMPHKDRLNPPPKPIKKARAIHARKG